MISTLIISIFSVTYLILFVIRPIYGIAFITAFRTLFLLFQVQIGPYGYSGEGFLTLMVMTTGLFFIFFTGYKDFPKVVLLPFAVFIFYCSLTFIATEDIANFLKKDSRLIGYFVLYLVIFRLGQDEKNISILNWSIIISIIVTVIPAICLFLLNPEQYTALENKPALGGIMKKNNFGFFSCYMLYFLFYFHSVLQSNLKRFMSLGLIIVQFLVFILSFTRAAWVGFIGALPVFLLFSRNKAKMIIPIIAIFVFGTVLFPIIYFGLYTDIEEKREYGMSSFQFRLEYAWPASIKAFKEKPIMGWGLGNNRNALYKAAGLNKTSHNDYLLVLVETGLIGLMCYLWLLAAIFIKTFKGITDSKDSREKSFQVTALAVFTAYLIGSIAEHLLQTPGATGFVFTILAMAHGQALKTQALSAT